MGKVKQAKSETWEKWNM